MGDNCIGILDAEATRPGAFTPDDMIVFATIARFLVPTVPTLQGMRVGTA